MAILGFETDTEVQWYPMAEPEEISRAVVWLAGDGSGVITGARIPVDKGYLAR
ncbi:SDR family oxidoreductase [Nocardia sp. NBC_01503]|uniref:SDR family oxidoreductase n=1 Tax=Nocardia sp. NBC_01503 TaxID=2975997 RepID=UPI003FA5885A